MSVTNVFVILIIVLTILRHDVLCKTDSIPKSRVVNISQGPVKGYQDPLGPYVFYEIPYATSPTGKDRFKPVLPPPSWMSTFEAVDRRVTCPQHELQGTNSEDCHVASIYVPDTNLTSLPVYIMIHGGAYQRGFGNRRTPKVFVQSKQIIAVTFNYRLSVHGLLCLGTKLAPGNAALKDQVAALRWVKKNIASFGGNPEDITISGSSAGASSADLLMLSKIVEGIFNKVVIESGSNIAEWSSDQEPLERAKRFAQRLNFTNVDDIHALEEFYTITPIDVLMSIKEMFAPCVERKLGEETFLEQAPFEIIKSGNYRKVPLLCGYCDKEGVYKVPPFDEYLELSEIMNKEIYKLFPQDLYFEMKNERDNVAMRVKKIYFGDKLVSVDTVDGFIDFQSDTLFIHPMLRAVKMHVEAGHDKVYLYEYEFPAIHNLPLPGNHTSNGATHVSQSVSVLDEDEDIISEDQREMKRKMRDLWHNFIITGTPVPSPASSFPEWPPVNSTNRTPYMILNSNLLLRSRFSGKKSERVELWDEIYEKYFKSAVPPQPY